jgi:ribosomal protein L3 glutamine methyltransferase
VFFGHGYPNAGAEADALLAWVTCAGPGVSREGLDTVLSAEQRLRLDEALRHRIEQRLPVPYVTGEAWIGPLRFEVTPQVLIPRSFIGELLLEGLDPWIADPARVLRALDLCTGSGCLAILLALAFPGATVDASDVSAAALEV